MKLPSEAIIGPDHHREAVLVADRAISWWVANPPCRIVLPAEPTQSCSAITENLTWVGDDEYPKTTYPALYIN